VYTVENYRTKKALKEAVANAAANGNAVTVFDPGGFRSPKQINGDITLEGPHFPEPHRWYARAEVAQGVIVKIIG
jgi:hypothetical protein